MTDKDTEQRKKYRPISLHSLRINTVTNFDMYIRYSEAHDGEHFVLYRKRNIPFKEHNRDALTEHGTETLYIDISDTKEYQQYLEQNLDSIIVDETVPLEEKSKIAYTCATGLVEDLLNNPRSGEHIQRSKAVISNLTDYLLDESRAFFGLMASTSFDYYTYTHSVNVAVFGIALAHRLGHYSRDEIKTIGTGLIVHDIGKSLIDTRILNKPGELNKEEWATIKEHPLNGVRLLRESGSIHPESLMIVECHHEKLDGSGYPNGHRGNAIHPYARLAALVDVFDALTTRRSYKPARSSFLSLELMRDEMGDKLDQEFFREFVLLLGAEDQH
jgi:HD-GYP domain-containing protein (c-di-GMP phosphodiesterase class II)